MTLFLIVLLVAMIFVFMNGFHDAASTIETVVSTKALTPRAAVLWVAFWNFGGAMFGTAVAKTISGGLIDPAVVTMTTVLAALIAAIAWNQCTWWLGLASSSSHALIGGLCGAALASAGGKWTAVIWEAPGKPGATVGLWSKVVLPMIACPLVGIIGGSLLIWLLSIVVRRFSSRIVTLIFGKAQLLSVGFMAFCHGSNDAQKTMGVIMLALFAGANADAFRELPSWASSLHLAEPQDIPVWVIVSCALAIGVGTLAGGWRLIRTMGHKMVKMQPWHGFAVETTAALILQGTAVMGVAASTNQIISASIMGVGASKRLSFIKWGVVNRRLWAWVLTMPVAGLLGYGLERMLLAANR